ncbi:MAG: carbohydrate-binding protein, partial [Armatimonadota bacterium]
NHTVRLTFETAVCNIDRISLVPVSSGPFLEAEDYTTYSDTTTGNTGGKYRTDSVDIDSGADGCYVGWTAAGEWLEYPVHGDSRAYVAVLRYAGTSQAKINLTLNGNNVTGDVLLPSTGNWQTWRSIVTPAFTLPAGASALRLNILTAGFNLNYITLAPIGDGGAGSDLLTGLHFAGGVADFNDVASGRGVGNWLYSTEVYANGNREPNDASFQTNMTDLIVNYLKPMVQNRIHPILRIDYVWGETIPRLLTNNVVDDAAVSKYVRTFTKLAQLADANGVPIRQFVVANEMNLKNEATGFTNAYIPEWYYAYVYDQIRTALSALGPGYELLVGAVSPGTLTPDPSYTPPDATTFYQTWSTDGFVYLDNICQELKRKGTQNIGFALHGYANFDSNDGYTSDAMWAVRKQLEVIEKSHTVTPYGQTTAVSMGGFVTAPVYITEWNRHTPQTSSDGPVFQETQTSTFISTFVTQISRFNRNREVWDNVSKVWRTYDPRDVQHNYHPIKGLCYFVFDTLGGAWGDYSLKTWHTLAGSATGSNDMYTTYQTQIGLRDPAGR